MVSGEHQTAINEPDASMDRWESLAVITVRAGAFFCFLGWWWVHFYWEAPYGVLIWHEDTFALAESFGISWESFIGTGANDGLIQVWTSRIGWIFLACALFCLTAKSSSVWQFAGLALGSMLLTLISYAKYLESGYELPMLVEQGGQILAPVLLVSTLWLGVRHELTRLIAIVALSTTFMGHGLYAMGVWPTPPSFIAMTSLILEWEYASAKQALFVVGVLDLCVCIAIFTPIRNLAALYAVAWGLLTALARPVAGMSSDLNYWGADQFVHETVYRAPHWMVPLFLFLIWQSKTGRLPRSPSKVLAVRPEA